MGMVLKMVLGGNIPTGLGDKGWQKRGDTEDKDRAGGTQVDSHTLSPQGSGVSLHCHPEGE